MVVRKQKKSRKQRGKTSHGWGFSKRHRGKGHQGTSGVGKRGAHRESTFHAQGFEPIGKYGMQFKPRVAKVPVKPISIEELDRRIEHLGTKQGDVFVVDLSKHGYNKVLGDGKLTHKVKVTCLSFSESAKEKIKKAGGEAAEAK
ncbi:MAG: uL15m family ribosomal protein [Candidatus Nanoarchaeia archaeon]